MKTLVPEMTTEKTPQGSYSKPEAAGPLTKNPRRTQSPLTRERRK